MKIHENPAFHTHFVDFGGVGTNETGWKPQNKENSSEIKGFGRFLGGEKLDFDDFHEFGRKSVLTAPKWSEKCQEFQQITKIPILAKIGSKNPNFPGQNLTKTLNFGAVLLILRFSAFFVGAYPPKVDKMSMKSRILMEFREKTLYYIKIRFQKHGFWPNVFLIWYYFV